MKQVNVKPAGWLLDYLTTQMDGLTGHIENAGFPYNATFWGADEIPPFNSWAWWWPFEQTAYHIDGYTRAAILLGKKEWIETAKTTIYTVLNKPDKDGYLGPDKLKDIEDADTRWPHVVFFRACLAMYDYSGDESIIEAITRHYLGYPVDYSGVRNVLNVEIMLALYGINKNDALLTMAKDAYDRSLETDLLKVRDDVYAQVREHGVTYNEYAKLGAILYQYTGQERYLTDSINAYKKIENLYLLPGGCNSSSEFLRNNRYDEVYETCDIADMSWTLHYLMNICDDTQYADMIEKCVFNAGMGSVTEDFRALQYFSCANQLILNEHSSHCLFHIANRAMRYAPNPFTSCCAGNVNRIVPNYVMNMWSCDENTVTARLYGPSVYAGEIDGKPFSIRENTTYPFELSVDFAVETTASFTFRIRVPGWSTNTTLTGAAYREENGYLIVDVSGNVKLSLTFDAPISQKENYGGVYFERGPLVYALGMKGCREVVGDSQFPAYRMSPDKPWNFAVVGDGTPAYEEGSETVWNVDNDLPHITVNVREVKNWEIRAVDKVCGVDNDYNPIELTGEFVLTPVLPEKETMVLSEEVQRITLYPYGACKVRMTVLPHTTK